MKRAPDRNRRRQALRDDSDGGLRPGRGREEHLA